MRHRDAVVPRAGPEWPTAAADADQLVVAACGLVRDPARAVVEPVWLLPDEAAAELTLAERVQAQARAAAWRARVAARQLEQGRRRRAGLRLLTSPVALTSKRH